MNKQFLHMQKLAGLITESEYKQKINEMVDKSAFQKLLNSIPNRQQFFGLEDEVIEPYFDTEYRELTSEDPKYKKGEFNGYYDSDLIDYFYDPIFEFILKGKLGIEGNTFNEWLNSIRKEDSREALELEKILARRIARIIGTYKKLAKI